MIVYNKYRDKYALIYYESSLDYNDFNDKTDTNTRFPKIEFQQKLAINRKYRNARRYSLPSFREFRPEI